MKYLYFLILVLALFSCAPSMTASNSYDKNGLEQGWWLVKSDTSCLQVVKFNHGFRTGVSKKVFTNGQYAILHYKHGKLNGTVKTYSSDHHLTETRVYKNDSLIRDKLQPEKYLDWKKYRRM